MMKINALDEQREHRIRMKAEEANEMLDDVCLRLSEIQDMLRDTDDYDKIEDIMDAIGKIQMRVEDWQ